VAAANLTENYSIRVSEDKVTLHDYRVSPNYCISRIVRISLVVQICSARAVLMDTVIDSPVPLVRHCGL
jgi:hypothetical protein